MLDIINVNETSPDANLNRQTHGQTDRQTYVLGGCASKKTSLGRGKKKGNFSLGGGGSGSVTANFPLKNLCIYGAFHYKAAFEA